ncbi:MAG: DUF427 domain-containing protein [Pseudomonadota bacterium]
MTELTPEHVQDYPRPPALEHVPQVLRVVLGGVEVARTAAAWRVLETHHAPTYYLPRSDIRAEALRPTAGSSLCEWKGRAGYFDVLGGDRVAPRAAWSYTKPTARFEPITGHVAFYPAAMDEVWVGAEQATAQPGDFYGGWVTSNLSGIVKGGPGTLGW